MKTGIYFYRLDLYGDVHFFMNFKPYNSEEFLRQVDNAKSHSEKYWIPFLKDLYGYELIPIIAYAKLGGELEWEI